MLTNFFSFSALSGVQGRKGNFLIQVPLKVLCKLLQEEDSELPIEQRSQRILNKTRVNQIANYIIDNPDSYILPPLVAYIKFGEVLFERAEGSSNLGQLKIDMNSEILLYDGQHRRAGVNLAVQQRPFLGDETIAIMLYNRDSVESAQQVFADININATKPAQSIKLLYNHRDQFNIVARKTIESVSLLNNYTDFERTNLAAKSDKLFTFSGIYQATKVLLNGVDDAKVIDTATAFWTVVSSNITEWNAVASGQTYASNLRENYVHAHSVVWVALAMIGNHLIHSNPTDWSDKLKMLSDINWSRNSDEWKDRCIVSGRISKSRHNIILTANHIMNALGVPLPKEHEQLENSFKN
jgi:DNA sulfur modification protein DndB